MMIPALYFLLYELYEGRLLYEALDALDALAYYGLRSLATWKVVQIFRRTFYGRLGRTLMIIFFIVSFAAG